MTKLTRALAMACPVGCCVVAGSCGGDASIGASSRPQRVNGLSAQFDRLRRYPRSDAASKTTRSSKGIVQQTFVVHGARPGTIVDWFLDVLPRAGWQAVESPQNSGTVARRGVWERKGRHLVVAASPAPTIGEQDADVDADAQYSFVLYPRGVAVAS